MVMVVSVLQLSELWDVDNNDHDRVLWPESKSERRCTRRVMPRENDCDESACRLARGIRGGPRHHGGAEQLYQRRESRGRPLRQL